MRGPSPLLRPADPERAAPEAGKCLACGGLVTGRVVPLWRERYPGEVEYRCEACHAVETPEMRARMRGEETRTCAAPDCTVSFRPRSVGSRWEKKYCSEQCSARTRQRELKAKAAARREAAREVAA